MAMEKFIRKGLDSLIAYLHNINQYIAIKQSHKRKIALMKAHDIPLKSLSSEQKKEIDAIFKPLGFKYDYDTHIICYSFSGKFDPRIIPETLCRTQLEPKLNDNKYKNVLSNKGYFNIFMNDVRFPETVVRNIKGLFYDSRYNLISKDEAQAVISRYDKLVFKPSIDSGSGKSVRLVNVSEEDILAISKTDYLIQKPFKQHKFMSSLNESTVNGIRITTLMVDGKVIALPATLRIGTPGHFTDNFYSKDGMGRIVVGLDENGTIKDTGYYACGVPTDRTATGVIFGGKQVPKFREMVDTAVKNAAKYPQIGLIGWDFVLGENEEVTVMEYNCKIPGILLYQCTNGAFFGNRTVEILKKIKNL